MSAFSHFHLQKHYLNDSFCDCFGGGDGGAGVRAAKADAEFKEKEARINQNVGLIDLLFQNDPDIRSDSRLDVNKQIEELRLQGQDPTTALTNELALLDEADTLLTGPTNREREATVVGDVENFFFDDLNQQREDAVRKGTFEVSRRAGLGGSQQLDFLSNLQEKEDRARLDIGNVGLDARNNLRKQDAALEATLIDQANRDISRDIITSDFVNELGSGLASARDTAKLTQLDPFFLDAGQLFGDVALVQGDQTGRRRAQDALSFFSANPSRNSGTVRT